MKPLRIFLFISFIGMTPVLCSAQAWVIITRGIAILQGLQSATEIYDWLNSEDDKAALVFTTNSYNNVDIYVNDKFVGSINRNHGITCKVDAGYSSYQAIHSDGRRNNDDFNLVNGVQHDVFITSNQSNMTYAAKSVYGYITGSDVNFRRSPNIAPNIISKLSRGSNVRVIDKMIVAGNNQGRITLNLATFHPTGVGEHPFQIIKGHALTFIKDVGNGYVEVKIRMKNRTIKYGYILASELGYMVNKKWYKIESNGQIGWIYGDFLRINA